MFILFQIDKKFLFYNNLKLVLLTYIISNFVNKINKKRSDNFKILKNRNFIVTMIPNFVDNERVNNFLFCDFGNNKNVITFWHDILIIYFRKHLDLNTAANILYYEIGT
jgi:hypothetical protein